MTKLYVGNLPYSFNDSSLRDLFASFGPISSVQLIIDKMSGKSKGFGFVELEDDAAQNAINELNGKEVEGRALVVNVARPMEDRPKRDFRPNNGGGFGGNNRGGRY